MKRIAGVVFGLTLTISGVAGAEDPAPADQVAKDLANKKSEEEIRGLKLVNDEKERALAEAKRKQVASAFPTSDTTGKVEVKGTAGLVEAQGLAALAVNGMANQIAGKVKAAADWSGTNPAPTLQTIAGCQSVPAQAAGVATTAVPVVLLTGSQSLNFALFDNFRFKACTLEKVFDAATAPALAEIKNSPAPAKVGSVAAIGAAVSLGTQLAKLVTPDWEVGSLEVKPSDRGFGMAIANAYLSATAKGGTLDPDRPIYWQDATAKLGGSNAVFNAIGTLDKRDIDAKKVAEALKDRIKVAQKAYDAIAKKPGAPDSKQKKDLDKWTKLLAPVTAASEAYSQFLGTLNGKQGVVELPLDLVVTQAATAILLGEKGVALSVAVENSSGGYYTRRVIWNVFDLGGPPFFATGGATVNFAVVRPADQRLIASGLFACNAGYTKVSRVQARLNAGAAETCKPPATGSGAGSGK